MAQSVLIETSVPSAYVSERKDAASQHRRTLTRIWWQRAMPSYECSTSAAVMIELGSGDWPGKAEAIALLQHLPQIEIDEEIIGVARRYIEEHLVPDDIRGDAIHLAVASVRELDFL